jgi:hypothetical protein
MIEHTHMSKVSRLAAPLDARGGAADRCGVRERPAAGFGDARRYALLAREGRLGAPPAKAGPHSHPGGRISSINRLWIDECNSPIQSHPAGPP